MTFYNGLDTFKYELWILCLYGEKLKKQEKASVR
jgi:hypothetical protein